MRRMSTNTTLPDRITAGTTVAYTRTLADYPASDGWTMTLYIAGEKVLKVPASAAGDDHVVLIAPSKSTLLKPGSYRYVERVEKAGDAYDATTGMVVVDPDLANAQDGDLQSKDEQLLKVLEDVIAGNLADGAIASYQIGGRAVSKIPMNELIALRNSLRATVVAGQTGRPSRKVLFTFPPTGFTT